MKKKTEILLVGTGAVGSYFGGRLAGTDVRVSALCRSDYEIMKSDGIEIRSYKGDFAFKPVEVIQNAAEYSCQPDYILVCLKVLPEIDQAAIIKPAIGPETAIVLIQNGIEIETDMAKAFPDNEIISTIAFIAVRRLEPGVVSHQGSGMLTMGNYPDGVSPKTERLIEFFQKAGVPCNKTEKIAEERWRKLIWNASFNPVSVLGGGADSIQMLNSPESENLVRLVMAEVRTVANATGNHLPEDIVETTIAGTRKMRPFKTSMLVDFEAGRSMEIDAILGNTIKIGKREGVPTPHLNSLYSLLKLHGAKAGR